MFLSKNGKKIRPTKWLTIQHLDTEAADIYFGITVSKKVGGAVLRNKLKRWVRQGVRQIKFSSKNGKKLVFVFRPQTEAFYEQLAYKEFAEAIKSLAHI